MSLCKPISGPPTASGWYWFQSATMPQAMMVEVKLIDGELRMMRYFAEGAPVADAKGSWRGPLGRSYGPIHE